MREIKFRGKRTDNGEWIYGDLIHSRDVGWVSIYVEAWNYPDKDMTLMVIPETVGEFTGLRDAKGVDIYEGDIVSVPEGYGGDLYFNSFLGIVKYDAPDFYVNQSHNIEKTKKWCGQDYSWDELTIVGNIHDNPDLLK